ncbi:MAG: protein-export chaperone SecB [Rhizobiaceae bacterium]
MAKSAKKTDDSKSANAGTEAGAGAQQQNGPMLSVLAQYVKDFSFENPHAPNSLRPRQTSPEINININVGANAMSQTEFEVTLKLDAKALAEKELVFNVELTYAGIFRLQGLPQEAMQPALLIECPRLLFPFARQIVSDATRNGGFPPLMIDPVDFARLYQSKLTEGAGAAKIN